MHELVGQLVMNRTSRRRGRITNIKDKKYVFHMVRRNTYILFQKHYPIP